MQQDTIRQLSAIAPPPRSNSKPWRFKDNRTAWLEVARLESEIGLPQGPKIIGLGAANARVEELERLKANKATGAPPKPSAPALVRAARTSAPMNTCEAMQRAVHSINANAATASPVAGKAIGEALAASGCRTARELRLTNDRDRIAADLPNIKGELDRECAIAKIAKLNSQIAQFKK